MVPRSVVSRESLAWARDRDVTLGPDDETAYATLVGVLEDLVATTTRDLLGWQTTARGEACERYVVRVGRCVEYHWRGAALADRMPPDHTLAGVLQTLQRFRSGEAGKRGRRRISCTT